MPYQGLTEPISNEYGYELVSIRQADSLSIARWRNEQMQVLRQSRPLTEHDQVRYFREVVEPSMASANPSMILVSYLLKGTCIGYGGLTHIDWHARRAEVSFLLDTSRTKDNSRYQSDFIAFLNLLKNLAFARLQLQRMFTETYDIRPYHVAALEAAGFKPEGRLRRHFLVNGTLTDGVFHGLLSEEYGV